MTEWSYQPEARWLMSGALGVAVLVFLSYYWAKGRLSRWKRTGLAALRWLTMGGILVCLLDPQRVEEVKHQPKTHLAVLLDTSRSMGAKDLPQGRLATAQTWLTQSLQPAIPAQATAEYYTFDRSLRPLESVTAPQANGEATGLADALEQLLALPREDPLLGVVVCSDGIENLRRNPEGVGRLYRRKGIPIHTVTVGTTNELKDVVVENVQVKRAVPNESPTRIGIALRAFGYRDEAVPVQIRQGNQVVARQTVKLKDGSQRVEMDFIPHQKGYQVYEVGVPVQDEEWLATNNRRWFGLEVVDPSIQVIYMEGTPQHPGSPIPEWKYLKDALQSDPYIKVRTLYRKYGANNQVLDTVDTDPETGEKIFPVEHPTKGFPHTLSELLKYDVIIHSDIRTQSFSREQMNNMARFVEEYGGGFVMIGGNSAFGKGGYHRTILDRIIPVAMQQEDDSEARPVRLRVPPNAYAHPIIALGATRQETELIWTKKLPVLHGCNLVNRAKPGAVVLGIDPGSQSTYGPRLLLAAQNIGKGRSMAFTSDTTRNWGKDFETTWGEPINPSMPLSEQNCDSRYFRQFWVNAVRWLAAGRLGRTNNPVTLELSQSYCLPGERVPATVKVCNLELKPIATAEVTLLFATADRTNVVGKAAYDRTRQCYVAELITPTNGVFTVIAQASFSGRLLGDDRQLLVCETGDREMADLRAQPALMAEIARLSGGQAIKPSRRDSVNLAAWFNPPAEVTVEHRRTPLWDRFLWLAVLLGLLSAEWVGRRLAGLA